MGVRSATFCHVRLSPHLKSKMPEGEEASKVRRELLLNTNSAMNLRRGVVTAGVSAHACSSHAGHQASALETFVCTSGPHMHVIDVCPNYDVLQAAPTLCSQQCKAPATERGDGWPYYACQPALPAALALHLWLPYSIKAIFDSA